MYIKIFAQGNKGISLIVLEPLRLAIFILLVQRVNQSTPNIYFRSIYKLTDIYFVHLVLDVMTYFVFSDKLVCYGKWRNTSIYEECSPLQRQRRRYCLSALTYKMICFVRKLDVLVYTEFILVRLCRKLLAYINTLESIPGTDQYWVISVKFLAQGNNGSSLTGFEPMRLMIVRLLVRRVNH